MQGQENNPDRYYGKFRAVVTDNRDKENLGRIRVQAQDVLGEKDLGWAWPAVPYAGAGVGFNLIPPKYALVWVEFEHGNVESPIWTGCFWNQADRKGSFTDNPDIKVLKTGSSTITFDESSDQPSLKIELGDFKIVMDKTGIELSSKPSGGKQQKVKITASNVTIDDGALEVT